MPSKTLTIVFTDIKGFTARTSESSREQLLELLERHEQLLLPVVHHFDGTVVKTIGDAFLLTFESPTNAVLCGLMMQETLRAANKDYQPHDHIEIRVAIHTGEVELVGDDIFGETVNIASRIEGLTDAGQVYFSQSTYMSMQKSEVPTSEVGEFTLKGIPGTVKIHRVIFDENLELYNKVVASQNIDREAYRNKVEADPSDGKFSRALLYSVEQEQVIGTGPNHTGRWVFASAVLLVLVFLGFIAGQSWQRSSEFNEVRQLVEEKRTQEALVFLADLHAQKSGDIELIQLLGDTLRADIGHLVEQHRFDEAQKRLGDYQKRFAFLPIHDTLERGLKMEKAYHLLTKTDSRKGHVAFEELLKRYPNDLEIKERFARGHHRSPSGRWDTPLRLFIDLLNAEPTRFKLDSEVQAVFRNGLSRHQSSSLQKVIAEHYLSLPDFEKQVLKQRYLAGDSNKAARRNAFGVLMHAKREADIDVSRFYAIELLSREHTDAWEEETLFAYWAKAPADLVIEPLPEPTILKQFDGRLSERVIPIIEERFAEYLKPVLMSYLERKSPRGYRLNAFRLATKLGWLKAEDELRYHTATLADSNWSNYQPDKFIRESIDWFATKAPKNKAAVEPLMKLREELKVEVSRTKNLLAEARARNLFQRVADTESRYQAQRDISRSVERALARMR